MGKLGVFGPYTPGAGACVCGRVEHMKKVFIEREINPTCLDECKLTHLSFHTRSNCHQLFILF